MEDRIRSVFYSAQVEMTQWQAYHYAKEMMAMAGVSINSTEGFTPLEKATDSCRWYR